MASFAGYVGPAGAVAAGINPPDFATPPDYAAAIDPPTEPTLYGPAADGGFAVSPLNFDGYLANSECGEEDGFVYGKFYLNYQTLNVGSVAVTKTYSVEIWNAHLHDRQLLSKSISQAGVELATGALPISFFSTEVKTYVLAISDEGPPNILCAVDLTFSDSEQRSISVIGFRAAMWGWWPQIPIAETIKPSTWIFESENGKEQRGKLRDRPRRQFTFDALLTEAEWRSVQNTIRVRHGGRWVVPQFEQAEFTSSSYAEDDTVINVDTTAAEYYVGGLAVVWKDSETWFVGELASKTASSITFTGGLDDDYDGPLRIMPAVTCRLGSAVSSESDRVGNRKIKPSFEAFDGMDLSGASDSVSLGGYGVMLWATEGDSIPQNFKTTIWSVDFDNGQPDYGSTRLYSLRSLPQKTTLLTRAEIYAFKRWVHTKHGAVPFWVPSRFKDLYLSANLGAGTSTMRVVNNTLLQNQTGAVALALFYPDGTVDYRRVDGIAEYSETETTITLSAATSNAGVLTPAQVRICWLMLCRIDGDPKLEHTGYDAEASFTVKEVMQ